MQKIWGMYMSNISPALLPASFRGVPFLLVSHKQTGLGRKTVSHEYPFKNTRFIQDLGKNPRVFSMTAIITNDDGLYFINRAALEEALALPGSGFLIHPFSGVFLVKLLETPTIEESDQNLNIVTFKMLFGETVEDQFPSASGDLPAKINSLAAPLRDAIARAY